MKTLYEILNEYNNIRFCIHSNPVSTPQEIKYYSGLSETHCPISLEPFRLGDTIIKLPCEHYFSRENILEWITNFSSNCPICRHRIQYYVNSQTIA